MAVFSAAAACPVNGGLADTLDIGEAAL